MENTTRTPHLDSRLERARTHFANPSRYLTSNYNISLRARIVKQLLGEISNCRILDLGCGDRTISLQFLAANNHITLVDSSDGMLERAKLNTPSESVTHVDYVCRDIFEFDPDARFDVVLCIGVLAHISSTEGAIAKVAGHLKPGGRCVFQMTDDSQLIHKINRWFYSVGDAIREFFGRSPLKLNRMSLADVVASASQHGLKLTAKQRHRLMLFPGMAELLGRWVIPYDSFVQKRPLLSRHSADVILLFEKTGTYDEGQWRSSHVHGIAGETMLNFGPFPVPLAYMLFGMIVGRLRRFLVTCSHHALPCIGSSVGGTPELLAAEDTVPPNDASALARKILEKAREYRYDVLSERRRGFYEHVKRATAAWLKGACV